MTPRGGGCYDTQSGTCSLLPAAPRGVLGIGKMEAQELFRRLGAGARFDVRRFGQDARRFGVRSHRGEAGAGAGTVTCATWAPGPRPFRAAGPRACLRPCRVGSGRGFSPISVLSPSGDKRERRWRLPGEPRLLRAQGGTPPGV